MFKKKHSDLNNTMLYIPLDGRKGKEISSTLGSLMILF